MDLMRAAFALAAEAQKGSADTNSAFSSSKLGPSPAQESAFSRYIAIIGERGRDSYVLDVGSEPYYRARFEAAGMVIEPYNLPADMHDIDAVRVYDGVIASHVLEHSPFPLYVLMLLARALKAGGFLLLVVPHPIRPNWIDRPDHFSVLAPGNWRRLLDAAGFDIVFRESGQREKAKGKTEERFLCVVR